MGIPFKLAGETTSTPSDESVVFAVYGLKLKTFAGPVAISFYAFVS